MVFAPALSSVPGKVIRWSEKAPLIPSRTALLLSSDEGKNPVLGRALGVAMMVEPLLTRTVPFTVTISAVR